MDHQSTKRILRLSKELCDVFEERAVDMDLVLPDYIPEVTAVLRCALRPVITAQYQSGDRYTVSGTATVRLLYLTEARTDVYCYEAAQPFTVSFASDKAIHHTVCTKADYVHARAVSPRRVDVHGAFRVYLKALGICEQTVYTPSAERDIRCRKQTACYSVPFCETEKSFVVEDRLNVKTDIDRIVCSEAVVLSSELKPLVNKAILKGVLQVKILGCRSGQYVTDCYELPFSQIVDIEGLSEERVCRAEVRVGEYEIRMQSEENGTASQWFDGKLCATVQCFERCEEELITDVYSVDKPILCETASLCFDLCCEESVIPFTLRETLACPEGLTEVIDASAELKSAAFEDAQLRACLTVSLIGREEGGTLCCYERNLEISQPCDVKGNILVLKVEAVKRGDDVRFQLLLTVRGALNHEESVSVVCNTVAEHREPYVKTGAAIRVVYAEAGDSVWEIAKKHHACAEDIMAENDLTDWTLTVPTMLMIPML